MYSKRIITTVAVFALIALLQGCKLIEQHVEKPKVALTQTTFKHMSYQQGVLQARLQLTNPNNFSLPINNMTYHLQLNQQQFAQSQITLDRKIPANGTVELELPVTIRYQELLGGIVAALQSNSMDFKLSGEVDFGLISVPYQKSGSFRLR